MVEYYPISAKDQSRLHQFGTQVLPGIFLGIRIGRGVNLEGRSFGADLEDLEKLDASEIYPRRITHSEREPTVRSEDFSRELQGEPGGPQPTESTDDAEALADFLSIQGDFILSSSK